MGICKLEMESLGLWHGFLLVEAFFHILALIVGATFVAVFSRLRSVHIHLILVLDSFVLSFCFTSIFRLQYAGEVVIFNLSPDDDMGATPSRLRDIGMFAGGLHMVLVALERLVATVRAREYEKENIALVVVLLVAILWISSFLIMTFLMTSAKSRFLIAGIFIFADVVAISVGLQPDSPTFQMMYFVRKKNLYLWRQYKGTLGITHGYQVRENVRTSLFLCRAFSVFAFQSFVAMMAYLGYAVCCMFDDYAIPLRIFGFVFDLMIAIVPITVSGMIVSVHTQLREKFAKTLFLGDVPSKQSKVMDMVDFDGKKLAVKPKEETAVYFEQFRTAWA